jgi:pimeloyl-ACP methyl ester carboxylesterase
MRTALEPGAEGWGDEDMLFSWPWGFELHMIRVPVLQWHGRQDQFVPFAHGEWLATQIPGVESHFTAQDGHLTLFTRRLPDVHAWLLDRFN